MPYGGLEDLGVTKLHEHKRRLHILCVFEPRPERYVLGEDEGSSMGKILFFIWDSPLPSVKTLAVAGHSLRFQRPGFCRGFLDYVDAD